MAEGSGYLKQTLENKRQERKAARLARAEKLKALTVLPRSDEKNHGDDVEPDMDESDSHAPDFFPGPGTNGDVILENFDAPMPTPIRKSYNFV